MNDESFTIRKAMDGNGHSQSSIKEGKKIKNMFSKMWHEVRLPYLYCHVRIDSNTSVRK